MKYVTIENVFLTSCWQSGFSTRIRTDAKTLAFLLSRPFPSRTSLEFGDRKPALQLTLYGREGMPLLTGHVSTTRGTSLNREEELWHQRAHPGRGCSAHAGASGLCRNTLCTVTSAAGSAGRAWMEGVWTHLRLAMASPPEGKAPISAKPTELDEILIYRGL